MAPKSILLLGMSLVRHTFADSAPPSLYGTASLVSMVLLLTAPAAAAARLEHMLQDLDDGAYHEEDEQAETFDMRIQDVVALEWSTSHSLGLGSNDYTPALVMHVIKTAPGQACCHGT